VKTEEECSTAYNLLYRRSWVGEMAGHRFSQAPQPSLQGQRLRGSSTSVVLHDRVTRGREPWAVPNQIGRESAPPADS